MTALGEVVTDAATLDRYYRAQAANISQVEAAVIELQTQATVQNNQLREMEGAARANHKRAFYIDQDLLRIKYPVLLVR